jgi:two-component system response regulator AtoC
MGGADDSADVIDAPTLVEIDRCISPGITVLSSQGRAEYALPLGGVLTIGRGPDCDVRIEQSSISRKHLRIYGTDPIEIEDLGSANGTWLDGELLDGGKRIRVPMVAYLELGSALVIVRSGATRAPSVGAPFAGAPAASSASNKKARSRATPMAIVRERLSLVAKSRASVLIVGETGVGKGVLAETIHHESPRATQPFVEAHCAALPGVTLERELFGFEPGAFIGATRAKRGLMESAHGGTLLLDDVEEMSLPAQVMLLRALETRRITRLGGTRSYDADVRLLATTTRDLRALVEERRFRSDLYFRLEQIVIVVPPLRERLDEIPNLAATFVQAACERARRPPLQLSEAAIAKLKAFTWPGNVRQLRNVLERAVLLCSGIPSRPRIFGSTPLSGTSARYRCGHRPEPVPPWPRWRR